MGVFLRHSPKQHTNMTEITAISRMTGKISYHATFPRKITEAQVKRDLKEMHITDEKYIVFITHPEK